jgi:hypothetical protein
LPSLREYQQGFARAVLGGDSAVTPHIVAARGLAAESGLAVYRNNMLSNVRAGLRISYPVVLRLIGEDCFRQAADEYLRQVPSTSGDLAEYGGSFGDFLARYPATRELVYLPDVARLEWAIDEAGRAADASLLELARLAAVAPQQLGALRFRLHPSARLIASPYPIFSIWQVNQSEYRGEDRIDLAQGGVCLLVMRRTEDVDVEPVAEAEFALLCALHRGAPLGTALEAALAVDAAFELAPCLQRHGLAGSFTDFEIAEGKQ